MLLEGGETFGGAWNRTARGIFSHERALAVPLLMRQKVNRSGSRIQGMKHDSEGVQVRGLEILIHQETLPIPGNVIGEEIGRRDWGASSHLEERDGYARRETRSNLDRH